MAGAASPRTIGTNEDSGLPRELAPGVQRRCRALRRRDPALPVRDPPQRQLLGQVIELVPLVVRAMLRGVGDLREREEPEPRLVAHAN